MLGIRSEIRGRYAGKALAGMGVAVFAALLLGCDANMKDQPRFESLEQSDFYPDQRSARPAVPGTVARGQIRLDPHLYEGKVEGKWAKTFPFSVTGEVLRRGRERYDIYCSPCHDRVGKGEGMVVRRGFRQPPSFHEERLRMVPPGHFYDAIANGFGTMPSYKDRIPVSDRWAIIAYIRALQLSQRAILADAPPEECQKLTGRK